MEVQAVRVVARQVAQEAVAVLGRPEARADGATQDAEPIDRANGRPRVLRAAERDVGAGAAVPGVVGGDPVVVVDDELGDLAVLPEVLRLIDRW